MKTSTLLKLASFFSLFTFVGHTIGIFLPIPKEHVNLINLVESMKQTYVIFPIGKPKSYYDVFLGNNYITSLSLLFIGIQLLLLSLKNEFDSIDKKHFILLAVFSGFLSLISILLFFPFPSICMGICFLLILIVYKKINKVPIT